jgi:PAS domain S-box-containing protein
VAALNLAAETNPGVQESASGSTAIMTSNDVFVGGGETGAIMRAMDWSSTHLGPPEQWPQSLRTSVSTCLNSRFAILVWWGPELVMLYNDSYAPIAGNKHPKALGSPGREVWPEIWEIIGPMLEGVLERGEATWADDLLLLLNRNGYQEECYFTFSYSPIRDESGGVGGIFTPVFETTGRVLSERRLRTSRDLADARAASGSSSVQEACQTAIRILAQNSQDFPFAAIYLFEQAGDTATLVASTGAEPGTTLLPATLSQSAPDSLWVPLTNLAQGEFCDIDLASLALEGQPTAPWGIAPIEAIAVPMLQKGKDIPTGFLLAGVNPRKRLNDEFRSFYRIVADQIGNTIREVEAFEQERKRAEALAEIDRAKTTFFTNISHEFRTPLTLLLGPLEETLAEKRLPPDLEERLTLAHRNSLRLHKLVNSLLDFSRLEADRVQAVFEPVDLATITTDLASAFRSAVERAGLRLTVDCQTLSQPVYVDRDMWEKVVLNLLSNAFKFTLEGEIKVVLRSIGDACELAVIDTGIGIPESELPHLFERFYRVNGAAGRSFEGSGIGLALVRELVRQHGGEVHVQSEPGRGSIFTVSIPFGSEHLPADRIGAVRSLASTATGSAAYVEEALRWLPGKHGLSHEIARVVSEAGEHLSAASSISDIKLEERPRLLLADDNADMRDYLCRLLSDTYDVKAVGDGEAALEAIAASVPDLVLTDVMMPRLDGFGLLKALRSDTNTATIPVILLSARAGEESRLEGIAAGADDYVVKPFSARELLVRIDSHLKLARLRRENERALRESEERLRTLVTATSNVVYRMSPDWTEMRQLYGQNFVADTESPSRTWLEEYIHPLDRSKVTQAIESAIASSSVFELEHRVRMLDGTVGWTFSRAVPLQNANGEILEWIGAASDVTERKQADELQRKQEAELRDAQRLAHLGSWQWEAKTGVGKGSDEYFRIYGQTPTESVMQNFPACRKRFYSPENWDRLSAAAQRAMMTGIGYELDLEAIREDGSIVYVTHRSEVMRNEEGQIIGLRGTVQDITERKRAEEALLRSEKLASLGRMAASIAHEINNPLAAVTNALYLARSGAEDAEFVRRFLDIADEELKRVSHITRQTLGFYRESSAPGLVSVCSVMDSAIDLLQGKIKGKGAVIERHEKRYDQTFEIIAVSGELRQVFSNLLANSLDAIEQQGVIKLRVSPRTCPKTGEAQVRVTIADNGDGIDAKTLPHIFEPLFTTKEATGSGLGLWVSKQIIEKHGGRICVRSSVDPKFKGTIFSIALPAAGVGRRLAAAAGHSGGQPSLSPVVQ